MKKILMMAVLASVACFAAEQKKDAYDIRPDAARKTDAPTSAEWQAKNQDQLAAATRPEVLAEFVKSPAEAALLLAEVNTGYATDPMKAFQIAAVTQYVMQRKGGCPFLRALAFWNWFSDSEQEVWAKQLLTSAALAAESDVKMFYLDQLRWCGLEEQAASVRAIGKNASCRCVQEFAEQVASELDHTAVVHAPLR